MSLQTLGFLTWHITVRNCVDLSAACYEDLQACAGNNDLLIFICELTYYLLAIYSMVYVCILKTSEKFMKRERKKIWD